MLHYLGNDSIKNAWPWSLLVEQRSPQLLLRLADGKQHENVASALLLLLCFLLRRHDWPCMGRNAVYLRHLATKTDTLTAADKHQHHQRPIPKQKALAQAVIVILHTAHTLQRHDDTVYVILEFFCRSHWRS